METAILFARLLGIENFLATLVAKINAALVRLAALEQRVAGLAISNGMSNGGGGTGTMWPAVVTASVSGYSGTTPGTGTVNLYTLSGGTVSVASSQTVYSMFSTSVLSGKNVNVCQDVNGNYWVVSGDC